MKKLSSDVLYFRGLIGLFTTPILVVVFINFFWVDNFSDVIIKASYFLLAIIVIIQIYKLSKYRKILYNSDHLTIIDYISKKEITVPVTEIIDIKKAFIIAQKQARLSYKITFNYDNKTHKIYFFKSLKLYNVENMKDFLDIRK